MTPPLCCLSLLQIVEVVKWKTRVETIFVKLGCDGCPCTSPGRECQQLDGCPCPRPSGAECKELDECGICGGDGRSCGEDALLPFRYELPGATECPEPAAVAMELGVAVEDISLSCQPAGNHEQLAAGRRLQSYAVVVDVMASVPPQVAGLEQIVGVSATAIEVEYDCNGNIASSYSDRAQMDLCGICGGENACISCLAGQEKCETVATLGASPICPTGCRSCLPNAVSDPGELCHHCEDGKQPNVEKSTCIDCGEGMAGRNGSCELCQPAKQPAFNKTDCIPCSPGKYKADSMLQCDNCPAGWTPSEMQSSCDSCPIGKQSDPEAIASSGTAGFCAACPNGTFPSDSGFNWVSTGAVLCTRCPVGTFSIHDPGMGSRAFQCAACPEEAMTTASSGATGQSDCLCIDGKYDSELIGIIYGHPGSFGDHASQQLMEESQVDIDNGGRCISCPDREEFMTCPFNISTENQRLGLPPVVQHGYAEFALNFSSLNHTRNFFKCPFEASCKEVHLRSREQGSNHCERGYGGTLCAECNEGWAHTTSGCVECRTGASLIVLIATATVVLATVLMMCKFGRYLGDHCAGVILWIAVAQRVWPRVKQSLQIIMSNYQIAGSITSYITVEIPNPFGTIVDFAANAANLAMDAIPSLACLTGGGYVPRLISKLLLPAVLLLVVETVHCIRIFRLVHVWMPITPSMRRSWRVKIGRALIRARFARDRASWAFAIVYLLYPSTTAVILDAFFCRSLTEGGHRVLMADYSIVCFHVDSVIDSTWAAISLIAGFFFILWSIGIPALLAVLLYKNRATIASGNFNYVGIAALRPLFMFFKPHCYMFEVYYMIEKLLMTGVVRLVSTYFGGFFLANGMAIGITNFMLCLIVAQRPSKTIIYFIKILLMPGKSRVKVVSATRSRSCAMARPRDRTRSI
eukprot:SAG31_NODE_829_length_11709_cov_5.435917_3_plen_921_part_00